MTAKDRLKHWLKSKRYVKTSEIIRWGANGGYSNRADRNARILREEGFLRRMTHEETQRIFGKTNELAYEVILNSQYVTDKAGQMCLGGFDGYTGD